MVYKIFDKKTGAGAKAKSKEAATTKSKAGAITKGKAGVGVNKQPAHELYKPVIKKSKRRKVYARLKFNIWAADLASIGSLSTKN